jgi:apocytochrome f
LLIAPKGFGLAPASSSSRQLSSYATKYPLYIQPYSKSEQNILVVGPIAGVLPDGSARSISIPVLAQPPSMQTSEMASSDSGSAQPLRMGRLKMYAGANRGRGQVYPTGDASNALSLRPSEAGQVQGIYLSTGTPAIKMSSRSKQAATSPNQSSARNSSQELSAALSLNVRPGTYLDPRQPLTANPGSGSGFGQAEEEILLLNARRLAALVAIITAAMISQGALLLKKRQADYLKSAGGNDRFSKATP